MKEGRQGKVIITSAGGGAGKTTKTYRVTIPNTWAQSLGINPEDREILLGIDIDKIILKKSKKPLD